MRFDNNVNVSDVSLSRAGDHLYVVLISTGESITVQYQFHANTSYRINAIEFGNGTIWDAAAIQTIL